MRADTTAFSGDGYFVDRIGTRLFPRFLGSSINFLKGLVFRFGLIPTFPGDRFVCFHVLFKLIIFMPENNRFIFESKL